MLVREIPTPLDLAMLIVKSTDTWADGRSDDGIARRHSHDRDVAAIAQRLVDEDGAYLDALIKEHTAHPSWQRGAFAAMYEWRQQRPVESQRIVIRLDLSRARTDEQRAMIQGWLDATYQR